MASFTVTHSRAPALVRRIADLERAPERREGIALGLVDAVLEGDGETLGAALGALRDARPRAADDRELTGWLDAAIAFSHWALERIPSPAPVADGTRAHDFLRVIEGAGQLGSVDLRRLLETDETQVSRTGRRLLERGLVARRKAGRQVFWTLTPRGRRALAEAPGRPKPGASEFWREALRRGFEGAAGDQPGGRRGVDPTRERIIESTLELHTSQGIAATTWPQIAELSGVPIETIEALFSTREELFRSCGAHLIESLRLPPADRASEVFAGASTQRERVNRLVETLFGAYERGGDGIAAGRRERHELPAVEESVQAIEHSFDALAAEALRPSHPETPPVASLRALTDLEVWRALRDQGASPEAAVERASTAVERWLEAQPVR